MSTFDGGLYVRCKNAQFIMNMREENLDYVLWVKYVLSSVTGAKIYKKKDYNTDGSNRKPQVRIESRVHPFLTSIKERIYIGDKKVIDPHMLKLMDAEALAIIFMADGSASPNHGVRFHTKGYSYHDNMALSKTIYNKLGLRTNINRHNQYYELRLKSADIPEFVSIVNEYICPSFRYKLERLAPHQIGGDEIVWTEWKHSEVVRKESTTEGIFG